MTENRGATDGPKCPKCGRPLKPSSGAAQSETCPHCEKTADDSGGLLAGLATEWDGLDDAGKDQDELQSREGVIEDEPGQIPLTPGTQIESPPTALPSQPASPTDDSEPVFVRVDDDFAPDDPDLAKFSGDSASEESAETPPTQLRQERPETHSNTGTSDKPLQRRISKKPLRRRRRTTVQPSPSPLAPVTETSPEPQSAKGRWWRMAFLVSLAMNAVLMAAMVLLNRGTDMPVVPHPGSGVRVAVSNPDQEMQSPPTESMRANTPLEPARDVPQSIKHPESAQPSEEESPTGSEVSERPETHAPTQRESSESNEEEQEYVESAERIVASNDADRLQNDAGVDEAVGQPVVQESDTILQTDLSLAVVRVMQVAVELAEANKRQDLPRDQAIALVERVADESEIRGTPRELVIELVKEVYAADDLDVPDRTTSNLVGFRLLDAVVKTVEKVRREGVSRDDAVGIVEVVLQEHGLWSQRALSLTSQLVADVYASDKNGQRVVAESERLSNASADSMRRNGDSSPEPIEPNAALEEEPNEPNAADAFASDENGQRVIAGFERLSNASPDGLRRNQDSSPEPNEPNAAVEEDLTHSRTTFRGERLPVDTVNYFGKMTTLRRFLKACRKANARSLQSGRYDGKAVRFTGTLVLADQDYWVLEGHKGRGSALFLEMARPDKFKAGHVVTVYGIGIHSDEHDLTAISAWHTVLEPPGLRYQVAMVPPNIINGGSYQTFTVNCIVNNTGSQVIRNITLAVRLKQIDSPNDVTKEYRVGTLRQGQVSQFQLHFDFYNFVYIGKPSVPFIESTEIVEYEI